MAPIQSQQILDTKCFLQLKKLKYFLTVSFFFESDSVSTATKVRILWRYTKPAPSLT